jgi:hypothetical protein
LLNEEDTSVSVANAKKFLEAIENDPELRKEVGKSLEQIQKERKPELRFTPRDLEKAIRMKWGEIYDNCILCFFSEVPGF